MMEKKFSKKVLRFLELSKQFSKSEFEVVPHEFINKDNQHENYMTSEVHSMNLSNKQKYDDDDRLKRIKDTSNAESNKILSKAQAEIELLKEFYEYKELQVDLLQYFLSLEKLS